MTRIRHRQHREIFAIDIRQSEKKIQKHWIQWPKSVFENWLPTHNFCRISIRRNRRVNVVSCPENATHMCRHREAKIFTTRKADIAATAAMTVIAWIHNVLAAIFRVHRAKVQSAVHRVV